VTAAGAVVRARYSEAENSPFDGDLSARADELGQAYGAAHVWSASRLEAYRLCPFQFFVASVLGLQPRAEPAEGLDAAQLGTIYHRLFERLYAVVDVGIDPQTDAEALLAALPAVATAVLDEAPAREGFRATAWWDQTRQEIQARAARSAAALALYGPEFVPHHFERAFGFGDAPPLVLRDDSDEVRLHGYIDRVDVGADGRLRVIDYKTGGPTPFTQRAVRDGKKLQLPLYALAARDALGLGEPAEAFYWHVQQAEPSPFVLSEFKPSPAAAFEATVKATWEAVRGVRGGRFVPHAPDLGCPPYCPAAGFCWRCRPAFGG
jgi:ATP-dependent helicase/nuclease subunit B